MNVRSVHLMIAALGAVAAFGCGSSSTNPHDAAPHDVAQTDNYPNQQDGGRLDGGQTDGGQADGGQTDAAPQQDAATPQTFATATPITVDDPATAGTLADPATTRDFYKFTGTAGQHVLIATQAKVGTNPFDTTYLDLVITLYDSAQAQIARCDDPWPRSTNDPELLVTLPSAGTYYVVVEECNSAFAGMCAPAADITNLDYTLVLYDVTSLATPKPIVEPAADQDGTPANAIVIDYAVPSGGTAGQYGFDIIGGGFAAAGDVDVYAFTPPADTAVDNGRARAEFWLQPIGTDTGNGSTGAMEAWVVGPGGDTIAWLDQSNYGDNSGDATNKPANLSVPVALGQKHYLYVKRAAGATGAREFYYLKHFVGQYWLGQLEAQDATNGSLATPEVLTASSSGAFAVDGDITGATDVDYYSIDVTGKTIVSFSCAAGRAGSGLRSFKASLLAAGGGSAIGSATETLTTDLASTSQLNLPSGATSIILEVKAAEQAPEATGTSYRCFVVPE